MKNRATLYWTIILLVVGSAWILRATMISSLRVINSQMAPTLLPGDFTLGWRGGEIERGDVVWLKGAEPNLILRVIGLADDYVELDNCELTINGQKARYQISDSQSWLRTEAIGTSQWTVACPPEAALTVVGMKVPKGFLLLLPDARMSGFSPNLPVIAADQVEGKVLGIWFSKNANNDVRFYRLFRTLH